MDISVKNAYVQSQIKCCAVGSVVLWTIDDGLETLCLLITTQACTDSGYKKCWDLNNSVFRDIPKDAYVIRCDAKLEVTPQEVQDE